MSCYEWERGTLTLPAAEFSKVYGAVLAEAKSHAQRAHTESQRFWKSLTAKQKRDRDAYRQAAESFVRRQRDLPAGLETLLWRCAGSYDGTVKPRRVLKDDAAIPTNRTTQFDLGEAFISFDKEKRTVTWEVYENNHAVEHAHQDPVARRLFHALNRVNWTRGSGGVIVGNNEYSREDTSVGGGGNYITACYGPAGEKERKFAYGI